MKTFSAKPADINREWYLIDASSAPLGRLAVDIAQLLIGKKKPTFTPHVDDGDHVVVINASKIQVTGKKLNDKIYYRHSGYPGGISQATLQELLEKNPALVIEAAVYGMIPKNKLRDGRMQRLRVFANESHDHEAQKPKTVNINEKQS